MSTSLERKLWLAAQADTNLQALLGSGAAIRWGGMQEAQGSIFPSVTVNVVSAIDQYSNTALLITAQYRVQFTVFDTNAERGRQVEQAIKQFLTTFNAYSPANSVSPLRPNRVVNRRQGGDPRTDPLTYQRSIDAMIWNNEST